MPNDSVGFGQSNLQNPVGQNPVLQMDPMANALMSNRAAYPKESFVKNDTGTKVNIAPKDMEVPEWGEGLTWGLTAYRYNGGRPGKALMVRDARLPPENQRKGQGLAMYQHAMDVAFSENRKFASDSTVTSAGVKVWAALKRLGFDVQTAKNHKYIPGPQDHPELSHYETTDGSPLFWINNPDKK